MYSLSFLQTPVTLPIETIHDKMGSTIIPRVFYRQPVIGYRLFDWRFSNSPLQPERNGYVYISIICHFERVKTPRG